MFIYFWIGVKWLILKWDILDCFVIIVENYLYFKLKWEVSRKGEVILKMSFKDLWMYMY